MEKLKVLELFGGIGACTSALKRVSVPFDVVDYVEINKFAVKSYNAINGTNFEPQDITEWDKDIKVDLIMHGSPCQDFSLAGKQAGGDEGSGTRSSLMYETIRIVEKLKPKYVVWENVKNMISKKHKHNFDAYCERLEALGYTNYYRVLNAKDYGIPQNRERVFTISILGDDKFEFPEPFPLELRLKDLLEDEVDEKYYLGEKGLALVEKHSETRVDRTTKKEADMTLINLPHGFNQGSEYDADIFPTLSQGTCAHWHTLLKENASSYARTYGSRGKEQDVENVCDTLTASMGGGGGNVHYIVEPKIEVIGNYSPSNHDASRVVDSDVIAPTVKENHGTVTATNVRKRIRKLTPKECWRLMGFTDEEFEKAEKVNSNSQLYKQAGNSIVVNVLTFIFASLFNVECDFEPKNHIGNFLDKNYLIYDDYNQRMRCDQNTIGVLTTNCGSSTIRNGWKLIEF